MLQHVYRRLVLTLLVASIFLAVPATLAAQETPVETSTGPSSLMVLAFLLGVLAILAVGGRWLIRDSFQPDDE